MKHIIHGFESIELDFCLDKEDFEFLMDCMNERIKKLDIDSYEYAKASDLYDHLDNNYNLLLEKIRKTEE